jgi:hypothetical protein
MTARVLIESLPGLKHRELKPCALCGKPPAHDSYPLFWRLRAERFCVDLAAAQRKHGLELMLGSPALADVMGPDEDIAKRIADPIEVLVCEPCVLDRLAGILILAEKADGNE